MIYNTHGKPWDASDAAYESVRGGFSGSYAVYSIDGLPLFGRHVPGEETKHFVALEWSATNQYKESK